MENFKLKPCPFCGNEAHIIQTYCADTKFRAYHVHYTCLDFGNIRTGSCDSEESAAYMWNKRAGEFDA